MNLKALKVLNCKISHVSLWVQKTLKCHCQHHVKKFSIWFHSFEVMKRNINCNVVFKWLKCNENLYKNINNVTNITTNDSSWPLLCPAMHYLTLISNFRHVVNSYSQKIYVNNCNCKQMLSDPLLPFLHVMTFIWNTFV